MLPWQREHIQSNNVALIRNTSCTTQFLARLQEKKLISAEETQLLECGLPFEKSKKVYEILETRIGAYEELKEALRNENQTGALMILENYKSAFVNCGLISFDKSKNLGKGRSGTKVFKGKFDNRDVAVKVIREDIYQAVKEVELLKKLDNHDNIARYYFAEQTETEVYIALELCCITLQDEIEMKYYNTDELQLLKQCTMGVTFLHDNGIIHRDLKPANILLAERSRLKILDFGFSKCIDQNVSESREYGGTFDWMAPEILARKFGARSSQRTEISVQSDIFSLGCVHFYTITRGKHPFGEPFERVHNILRNLHDVKKSELEEAWKNIVLAMISSEPNDRPSSKRLLEINYVENNVDSAKITNPDISIAGVVGHQFDIKNQSSTNEKNNEDKNSDTEISGTTSESKILYHEDFNQTQDLSSQNANHAEVSTDLEDSYAVLNDIDLTKRFEHFKVPQRYIDLLLKDVNAMDEEANPILHKLMLYGVNVEAIHNCVMRGADLLCQDHRDRLLIHHAAENGKYQLKEYLTSLGVPVNVRDNFGDSPMLKSVLAKDNFFETFNALLEAGGDVNDTNSYGNNFFLLAVLSGRTVAELKEIVNIGGNPYSKNTAGQGAFHLAAHKGNAHLIEYLASIDLNINDKDTVGDTALFECPLGKDRFVETLHELVRCGANINESNSESDSLLLVAVCNAASAEVISEIVKLGININFKNKSGRNALHIAAQQVGNFGVISFLKSLGLNIDENDNDGETPIFQTLHTKYFVETINALVQNGANINAVNTDGNNVFLQSVLKGKTRDELQEIIDLGGSACVRNNNGQNAFHLAVEAESFSLFSYLKSVGVDINEKNNDEYTPLLKALNAKKHFLEIISELVKNGANINASNKNGNSVLALAAFYGKSANELGVIVQHGGNIQAKNPAGLTPLHLAAEGGNFEAVCFLTSVGADINARSKAGNTPLIRTVHANNNFLETVNALVNNKADINTVDGDGDSFVAAAAFYRRTVEELKEIVELGGNVKLQNPSGRNALHLAAQGGNFLAIYYLKTLDCDINGKDNYGYTPLLRTVHTKQHFTETLNALIENGADINAVDRNGKNLLWHAQEQNKTNEEMSEIVRLGISLKCEDDSFLSRLEKLLKKN